MKTNQETNKTKDMKPTLPNHNDEASEPHYTCGCCKQQLPAEAFYIQKATGRPSNYCKECRKEVSRRRRAALKLVQAAVDDESRGKRTILTEVACRELRIALIRQAMAIVTASVLRKRNRDRNREDDDE